MLTNEQRDRLQAWVLAVSPHALSYARSLVRDPSRADDLVQECLLRLLRRANEYDLERDGVKLLFTAISNLAINQATREKTLLSLDHPMDANGKPQSFADPSASSPPQTLEYQELESSVGEALQKLPPLQRAAIELRSLGMSKEQIAEVLDVSVSNAGVLVHRGRKALAAALGWNEQGQPLQGE